jgi:hypothetical protein
MRLFTVLGHLEKNEQISIICCFDTGSEVIDLLFENLIHK